MITNLDEIIALSERDYYSNFAFFMQRALYTNSRFYSWLIENMYEIFDKNKTVLEELLEKIKKNKTDIDKEDVFSKALFEYYKGEKTMGECTALGMVACAFIAYKLNILAMEEYYEIRDMFVPFNLPISISEKNIQPIFDLIKSKEQTVILFNRIGKAYISEDKISDEMIVLALDELNFNEED